MSKDIFDIFQERIIIWRYFDYYLQFILFSEKKIDFDFLYSADSIKNLKEIIKLSLILFDRIYIPLQDILFTYNPLACELIEEFFNDREIQELTEKGIITFSTWTNKVLSFKELHDQDDAFWQAFLEPIEKNRHSKDHYRKIREKIRKLNITLSKDNIFQRKPMFQSHKLFNLICKYLESNYIHQNDENLKKATLYFLETIKREEPSIWLIENSQIKLKAPFSKERFISFLTDLLEPKLPRKEKYKFKKTLSIIKKTNIIHQIEKLSLEAILLAHQKENTEVFILSYLPTKNKLSINSKIIDFNFGNLLQALLEFINLKPQDLQNLIKRTNISSIISNREALYYDWKLFQSDYFKYFTLKQSEWSYFTNTFADHKKNLHINSISLKLKLQLKKLKNILELTYNLNDILEQIHSTIKEKYYYKKLIKSILK